MNCKIFGLQICGFAANRFSGISKWLLSETRDFVREILYCIQNENHNYSLKVKPWNKLQTIPMSNSILISSRVSKQQLL